MQNVAIELCIVVNVKTRKRRYYADSRRISQVNYELLEILSTHTDTLYCRNTIEHNRAYKTVRVTQGIAKFYAGKVEYSEITIEQLKKEVTQ